MISVPAEVEADRRAGRPTVKKNMSGPYTTAVLRMPARDTAHIQWVYCCPPRFNRRPSKGMDKPKAGEEHHRAGHAVNGERCGLSAASH
jgi:hypothetical protein